MITGLTFLIKAELEKIWARPIFEVTVGLILLACAGSTMQLVYLIPQNRFQELFFSGIAYLVILIVDQLGFYLGLICSILVTLSFSRDYELGLLQTLMSLPVSRRSIIAIKFIAIVVPLTISAWGILIFLLGLNFYYELAILLQIALPALAILFIATSFFYCVATLISLTIKRTLPSVLVSLSLALVLFVLSKSPRMIGNFTLYAPLTAPVMILSRIWDVRIYYQLSLAAEFLPSAWFFLSLTLIYCLVPIAFAYFYFTRVFEVSE